MSARGLQDVETTSRNLGMADCNPSKDVQKNVPAPVVPSVDTLGNERIVKVKPHTKQVKPLTPN